MKSFKLIHSGFLYEEQKIEVFISAFRQLIEMHSKEFYFQLCFAGVEYDLKSVHRLKKITAGIEKHILTTPRLTFEECLKLENEADVLLITAYGDMKGIPSSKLYQYIGHKKPVMLCPSDHDIIETILTETGLGLIADTAEEAKSLLEKCLKDIDECGEIRLNPNEQAIAKHSRRNQTLKMVNILNKL